MTNVRALFTEHPASVNETYLQHMGSATSFSAAMILGGLACLVHAVFPFLCVRTGSRTIAELHVRMITNRVRPAPASTVAAPASGA
jgi:hypothetical protein